MITIVNDQLDLGVLRSSETLSYKNHIDDLYRKVNRRSLYLDLKFTLKLLKNKLNVSPYDLGVNCLIFLIIIITIKVKSENYYYYNYYYYYYNYRYYYYYFVNDKIIIIIIRATKATTTKIIKTTAHQQK